MSNFYPVNGIDLFFQSKKYIINTAKDPRPPTAFSVPNRKLEVGRRRRRKSQSDDPRYCKGRG